MPPKTQQKQIDVIRHWQRNPLEWVRHFFPAIRLSNQQTKFFEELGKLYTAKLKKAAGEPLTKQEEEYALKLGISVMSGQKLGKDFVAALSHDHFLTVFAYPKVMCTATTGKQLKNVLWSEISKTFRLCQKNEKGQSVLDQMFEIQAEKVFLWEKKGKEWFSEAVTINTKDSEESQAESLAGRNANYKLTIVDEASGIANAVFKPLEAVSGTLNVILMIFNPTRSKGYAVDSQFADKSRWIALRWDARDCDLPISAGGPDQDMIREYIQKYGENSNPVRIRVLGLPPLTDSNALIPWDWIEDAVEREIEPEGAILKGIDVGAGGDLSVVVTKQGGKVLSIKRYNFHDTMQLVGHLGRDINSDEDEDNTVLAAIDPIGVGKGAYDRLAELGYNVEPVDVRRTANDPQQFYRLRDELWWKLRTKFEKGIISIPDDKDLKDQLGIIGYEIPQSDGRIKVDSKKTMRKKLGGSPDLGDALMHTEYLDEEICTHAGKKKKDRSVSDIMGNREEVRYF